MPGARCTKLERRSGQSSVYHSTSTFGNMATIPYEGKPADDVHQLENARSLEDGKHEEEARALPLDPVEDRRVRRKIDLVVMPVICFIYALNFVSTGVGRCDPE